MGFFSKKSVSNNTSLTENYNTDARIAADGGAIVARDSNISITDGGAFELAESVTSDAFDLAEGVAELGAGFAFDALGFVQSNSRDTLDLIAANQNNALGFVQANQTATNDILGQVLEQQREESAQLGSQILRLGIPAIAILGLIFIMKGNG